jgi:hypothetical protein
MAIETPEIRFDAISHWAGFETIEKARKSTSRGEKPESKYLPWKYMIFSPEIGCYPHFRVRYFVRTCSFKREYSVLGERRRNHGGAENHRCHGTEAVE